MTLEQVTKELDVHFGRIDAILPELKSYFLLSSKNYMSINLVRCFT